MRTARHGWVVILVLLFGGAAAFGAQRPGLDGEWVLVPQSSTEIDLYGALTVEIAGTNGELTLIRTFGGSRPFKEVWALKIGGFANKIPIPDRVFPTNVFMGLSLPVGSQRTVEAYWDKPDSVLRLEETCDVLASQGQAPLRSRHVLRAGLSPDLMTYTITRPTRDLPITYILKRKGSREACYMILDDAWTIGQGLEKQAFLISLQGNVNRDAPRLYFVYPKTWDFNYTPYVFDFFRNRKHYSFRRLSTVEQALQTFRDSVRGYVVWDREVRTSLIVAYTIAGLERAVVVDESMIPLMAANGLAAVEDLRGKFSGWSDARIYQWALDRYGDRCSRDFVIWLGGEHGRVLKPGVADWGMKNGAFFCDLSSKPVDREEYELAGKVLGRMNPMAMVMGWHSYKKDQERDHVRLTSSFGLRVEGLHTLPNVSFSHHVPVDPGFVPRNHHNVEPGKIYTPQAKTYIACIQTDGMGLGAWNEPGRGDIPYAWEQIINYIWLAPVMVEYFDSTSTPNDYFIGALGGPGYVYPKAVPKDKLPGLIAKTWEMMELLDLKVFDIMDHSEGSTVEGNSELTEEVVDAFYKGMPGAIGFVNGYAPSFTFAVRDKRPLVSFDYYLSPTRTEEEATADLRELAALNARRPYFLLVHVREYSNVKRVKDIMDKLGPGFELVPLDVFLKMAGEAPTFRERLLKK
ncbi:MAG: GxGYxYP family putative glycoside hydrolase [Acidobacteriota bacterium]|nr:GxGYxYP family putative glycoside hydrolase [Acidobacteriota bacterium]